MRRIFALAAALSVNVACWQVDEPARDSGIGVPTTGAPTGAPTGGTGPTTTGTTPCERVASQPTLATFGTVTGRVTSPSGTVAVRSAIAEVAFGDESAWMLTHCDDGGFVLEVPPGDHTLSVVKGRWSASQAFTVAAGEQLDLGNVSLDVAPVAMAVVDGEYDDIGALMTDAGIPFTEFARPADLMTPEGLTDYQVVFVNCGTVAGRGITPYTPEQFDAVRAWVEAGGTLYVSDWEHDLFEGAFPEALDFAPNPRAGTTVAVVEADVLDRDIQTILQKETAELRFDRNGWAAIDGAEEAFPLVMGTPTGDVVYRPLAALMPLGAGKAIYTSFHNEQQITEDMEVILYEMILSL